MSSVDEKRPYRGAAEYYDRHRYRISAEFIRALVGRLGLGREDVILDLGCGPGLVARQLAPFVGQVVAVDPEPDMLAEAERRCAAEGLSNVQCLLGRSDDLPPAGLGMRFRAVVIGVAFHWMHPQDDLLRRLDAITDPDGGAVVLVSPEGPPPPVPWLDELDALLDRYLADTPRPAHPGGQHDPFPDLLRRSPFPRVETLRRDYESEHIPTLQSEIGFRYSLSWTLQRLGDKRATFEAEAEQTLGHKVTQEPIAVPRSDVALIGTRTHD